MKIRNKMTGEIGNLQPYGDDGRIWVWIGNMSNPVYRYNSLAELNAEWEDYEEPKEYWYIDVDGSLQDDSGVYEDEITENMKQIGNHFDTREEAEKAVEKIKAWKRLKDTGFEFTGWDRHPDYPGDFRITASDELTSDDKALDLLFGGEE